MIKISEKDVPGFFYYLINRNTLFLISSMAGLFAINNLLFGNIIGGLIFLFIELVILLNAYSLKNKFDKTIKKRK